MNLGEPAYVGVDPGMSGAFAIWRPSDDMLLVLDMPTHEINGKNRIDLYRLSHELRGWDSVSRIVQVVVENVNAMPPMRDKFGQQRGAGTASSFAFGFAAGAAQMAVASLDLPMVLVVPQVWKKVYGLRGGAENKDLSRQKASMLFPKHAHNWARKKDDGRAEAVLLAHYGSKLS